MAILAMLASRMARIFVPITMPVLTEHSASFTLIYRL